MRSAPNPLAGAIFAAWFAATGCGHSGPVVAPAPAAETPDQIVAWCARSADTSTCRPLPEKLKDLSRPGYSGPKYDYFDIVREIRAGRSGGLPPDLARAVRAVVSDRPVASHLDRVAELDRELIEYEKRDATWKMSTEAQTAFVDLTLSRSVEVQDALAESKRRLSELADRIAHVVDEQGAQPR